MKICYENNLSLVRVLLAHNQILISTLKSVQKNKKTKKQYIKHLKVLTTKQPSKLRPF